MARRRRGGLVVLGGLVGLAMSPAAARSRGALLARVERLRRRRSNPVMPFLEAPCHLGGGVAAGDESHEAEVVS
jgi:hypothetical protein